MAEGKNRNLSGDYTDSRNFDAYSPENQQYLRNHSQSTVDGVPIDKLENKEDGFLGSFRKRKDSEGNTKWGIGRDDLKDAEASASKDPNASGRGGDKSATLGEKEKNVEGDNESLGGKIRNSVKGVAAAKRGDISGAIKGIKKVGPLGAILAIVFGFAGVSFLGQLSMPFSLVAQFQENFDSISISQSVRSRAFLRYQLDNNYVKDCRRAHFFSAEEFKPSNRMVSKLASQGITFEDMDGMKVMRYQGDIIVADKSQAVDGRKWFDDAYANDINFREKYFAGAKTWTGSIAAWFDSSVTKAFKRIGIDRNLWKDYQRSKSNNGSGGDSDVEGFRNKVAETADSDTAGGTTRGTVGEETETSNEMTGESSSTLTPATEDADASLSRNLVDVDSNGNIRDTSALKQRLVGIGGNIESLKKASGVASLSVSVICGAADFVGAVSAIVAAYQAAQILKTTALLLEGVQKAQAGDGDGAPLHEIAQSLTQPSESTYTEVLATDDSGNVTDERVTTRSRSAMESNAIGALYGGTAVDMNDPSVRSFNINETTAQLFGSLASNETFLSDIMKPAAIGAASLSVTASSFLACTSARLGAAAIDAALDIAEVAACAAGAVVTFGAALVGCFFGSLGAGAALTVAATTVIAVVASFLTPFVAGVLTRKIATEVVGEDLGNAIVSGANMYMGQNHQSSGGSIANEQSLISFYQKQDQVIAENARFERDNRSPFDITSKYTFLGSIASQMIPIASRMSSITGALNGASTVLGNAISSLSPKSSAVSAAIKAQIQNENTKKHCPNIADIGGVSDAFCNPYFITDTSTINTHPADIVNEISEDDLDSDEEGNPVVKENSGLAKYIIYCGERTSQWGTADQNIMAQVAPSAEAIVDGVLDTNTLEEATVSPLTTGIGALPVIGDAADIIDNTKKLENMGWITGASCVTGYEKSGVETGTRSWSESKNYQRFIEDQRLAEAEGIVEESAVSKFVAQYYEKHPIDDSFEGILARYSGLTKENVALTLDAMKALGFIAEYDPSGLYPYPAIEEQEEAITINSEGGPHSIEALIGNNYVFPVRREVTFS